MPARQHHYVIVYDIEDNKERRRIDELLQGWGHRVQKSVFSVIVHRGQSKQLKSAIKKLNIQTGNVLMYRIQHGTTVTSFGEDFDDPHDQITYIV